MHVLQFLWVICTHRHWFLCTCDIWIWIFLSITFYFICNCSNNSSLSQIKSGFIFYLINSPCLKAKNLGLKNNLYYRYYIIFCTFKRVLYSLKYVIIKRIISCCCNHLFLTSVSFHLKITLTSHFYLEICNMHFIGLSFVLNVGDVVIMTRL